MKHTDWIKKVAGDMSLRSLSTALGYKAPTALATAARTNRLTAETVIKVAEYMEIDPIQALVDTGYLTSEQCKAYSPLEAVKALSDEELADEVLRRMKLGGTHTAFTTPVDNLVKMPSTEQLLAGGARFAALDTEPEPGPGDDNYND